MTFFDFFLFFFISLKYIIYIMKVSEKKRAILKEVKINTEFIKLGQFLKFINIISSGSDVKFFLLENTIYVNDEQENRRGRKLYSGDVVKIGSEIYMIKGEN